MIELNMLVSKQNQPQAGTDSSKLVSMRQGLPKVTSFAELMHSQSLAVGAESVQVKHMGQAISPSLSSEGISVENLSDYVQAASRWMDRGDEEMVETDATVSLNQLLKTKESQIANENDGRLGTPPVLVGNAEKSIEGEMQVPLEGIQVEGIQGKASSSLEGKDIESAVPEFDLIRGASKAEELTVQEGKDSQQSIILATSVEKNALAEKESWAMPTTEVSRESNQQAKRLMSDVNSIESEHRPEVSSPSRVSQTQNASAMMPKTQLNDAAQVHQTEIADYGSPKNESGLADDRHSVSSAISPDQKTAELALSLASEAVPAPEGEERLMPIENLEKSDMPLPLSGTLGDESNPKELYRKEVRDDALVEEFSKQGQTGEVNQGDLAQPVSRNQNEAGKTFVELNMVNSEVKRNPTSFKETMTPSQLNEQSVNRTKSVESSLAFGSSNASAGQGNASAGQNPSQHGQWQNVVQQAQIVKESVIKNQQDVTAKFNELVMSSADSNDSEQVERLLGSLGTVQAAKNALPLGMQSIGQSIRSPQWGQALGNRVVFMANNGIQEAKITLNPEKLGPVQIKLHVDKDQQVHVSMNAQQGMTREAMEQAIPRLKEMLEAAGIGLGSVNVGDGRTFAETSDGEASGGERHTGSEMDEQLSDEDGVHTVKTVQNIDNLVDYYA